MAWWDRVVSPMQRVWLGIATRLGFRKTGLRRLRDEVDTCEYEDVHVLWELLRQSDAEFARFPPVGKRRPPRRRRRQVWAVLKWARCAAPHNLCRGF